MISPEERQQWLERTSLDRPNAEAMSDPLWRFANLYTIKDKAGQLVPFVPNEEQIQVIVCLELRGWKRLLIPKARQLGMSTALALICLDFCLFSEGFAAALVDKKQDDANEKLRDKVRLAWEQQTPEFKAQYTAPPGYPNGIAWRWIGNPDEAASSFTAGISFRGGTVQFLWISEWGWIQANDAARSHEILTGSLPTAEQGITVVETTWEGGKGGDVWPLVEEALTTPEAAKGPKTWRILFFPWWTCADYQDAHGYVDEDSARYLAEIEGKIDCRLSDAQKRWYAGKRRTMGGKIKQEFPSTLEECWEAPVPGAIWAEQIAKARIEGRIGMLPVDARFPVHTTWDIGSALHTVVWYFQRLPGGGTRFVDCDIAVEMTMAERAAFMQRKGYAYGFHFLPHDANANKLGATVAGDWTALCNQFGIGKVRVVPRPLDLWHGIDGVTSTFGAFEFRLPACAKGIEGLEAYRRQPVKNNGVISDEPVHDWASHVADPVRYVVEADRAGLIPPAHNAGPVGSSALRPGAKPIAARMAVPRFT